MTMDLVDSYPLSTYRCVFTGIISGKEVDERFFEQLVGTGFFAERDSGVPVPSGRTQRFSTWLDESGRYDDSLDAEDLSERGVSYLFETLKPLLKPIGLDFNIERDGWSEEGDFLTNFVVVDGDNFRVASTAEEELFLSWSALSERYLSLLNHLLELREVEERLYYQMTGGNTILSVLLKQESYQLLVENHIMSV